MNGRRIQTLSIPNSHNFSQRLDQAAYQNSLLKHASSGFSHPMLTSTHFPHAGRAGRKTFTIRLCYLIAMQAICSYKLVIYAGKATSRFLDSTNAALHSPGRQSLTRPAYFPSLKRFCYKYSSAQSISMDLLKSTLHEPRITSHMCLSGMGWYLEFGWFLWPRFMAFYFTCTHIADFSHRRIDSTCAGGTPPLDFQRRGGDGSTKTP
jgi:hypothetical protein